MTTTPNKGYTEPTVGGDTNVWGGELNNNFVAIDLNLGGTLSVSMSNADVTLNTTQAQNLAYLITGTLTLNVNLVFPAIGGFYIVNNQTTGSFSLTVTTGSGATVIATQGSRTAVYCDGTNMYQVGSASGGGVGSPHGRLTLTSATPVLTSTVTGAGTVYYTPYIGNSIPIWTGSSFSTLSASELSNVLANSATGNAGPAAAVANAVYDLYVWSNSGVITLTRSPAWASTTTRGTGAGSAQQSTSNGIVVNTFAITNGPGAAAGTYVGTIATDSGAGTVTFNKGSAAASGGPATIGLWNYYNRVNVNTATFDTTASFTSNSTSYITWQSTSTRVTMVRGADDDSVSAQVQGAFMQQNTSETWFLTLGLDSTTAAASLASVAKVSNQGAGDGTAYMGYAGFSGNVGIGVHYLQALTKVLTGTNATQFQSFLNGVPEFALFSSLRY